jgi:acetyltransferase-like isoleucine patch superfamily enzyme
MTHPRWLLRALALRLRGVRCSLDGVRVDAASRIERGAMLASGVHLLDTRVGRFTSLGRGAKCHYADLGPFCSVAWDVTIGATSHPLDRASTHAFAYRRAVGAIAEDAPIDRPRARLGPDVWVGTHVVVLPGVEIGAGAVLGAGSVVARDVRPYAIVAGAPARELRRRVPEETVERLLALAWWDWPLATLEASAALFREPVGEDVLEALESIAKQARGYSHPR